MYRPQHDDQFTPASRQMSCGIQSPRKTLELKKLGKNDV